MKKYRFRLATVLRVRRIQEEQKKAALLQANRQVLLAQKEVDERLDAYKSKSAAASKAASNSAAADFVSLRELQKLSAEGVKYSVAALVERQGQADVARIEWAEQKQKVQMLERLDDRRREEHRLDAERKEAVEIDDIVVARHGRTS